jgi:hypothetical protein
MAGVVTPCTSERSPTVDAARPRALCWGSNLVFSSCLGGGLCCSSTTTWVLHGSGFLGVVVSTPLVPLFNAGSHRRFSMVCMCADVWGSCRGVSSSLSSSCIVLRSCWCPSPTDRRVVPVLMSQCNRVSIDSLFFSFFLFPCLRSSRTVVLYFFCYVNGTRTILCGSFKKNTWSISPHEDYIHFCLFVLSNSTLSKWLESIFPCINEIYFWIQVTLSYDSICNWCIPLLYSLRLDDLLPKNPKR